MCECRVHVNVHSTYVHADVEEIVYEWCMHLGKRLFVNVVYM